MKVIFLDIDGVLNVIGQGHDEFGQIFHQHFMDNLKRIVDETGAKIVMSSSWRHAGLAKMQAMWEKRGLAGELIGVTPDLWRRVKDDDLDKKPVRGDEIQVILNLRPEITNYVILDDDQDMLDSQLSNFVCTSNNINHPDCIDIGYGLTNECANKAIRILNRK